MKLVQLIYTSRAKSPVTLDLVRDIIQTAVKHNQAAANTLVAAQELARLAAELTAVVDRANIQ